MTTAFASPPAADGLPFLGSLIPMLGDPTKFFADQYVKHGPVFNVRILNRRFTVIGGPEAIEYLADDDALTTEPVWKPFVTLFGGKRSLLGMSGEEHTRLRKVMRRGLSRTAALDATPMTIETTRGALQRLTPGQFIHVSDFVRGVVTDVLSRIALGRTPEAYFSDIVTVFHDYVWVYIVGSKSPSTFKTQRYRRALARVRQLAERIIQSYERGEVQPGESPFADDLIAAAKLNPDFLDRNDLIFGLIIPYIAGLDTVATMITFMLYEIVRNPALLERMTPEIDGLFANGTPQPEHLRNTPLLHATAMETLRWYNVVPMLRRVAKKSFDIAGCRVEAGEPLQLAIGVTHRLERFFKQPLLFDIDRYLPPRNEHKQRNAFAPFGAGPHTCLGAGMAEVITALIVSTMVHQCRFAMERPGYRIKGYVSADLKPAPGFRLRLLSFR